MGAAKPFQPDQNECFRVLGVRVDAVQIPDVVGIMERWIVARDGCHYIAVTGMHGVTEAQHDPAFKAVLNSADLVVPDGMPLVWLGRSSGYRLRRRVYGPELMLAFCERAAHKGYRHFFYGGAEGVPDALAEKLRTTFPGLQVAGTISPPFRALAPDENRELVDLINRARPDVLWVGLSTPKQERWMHANRGALRVPAVVGVGAAFDLNSGRAKQAPVWMRENGLEWSFRLMQEPRRLWRRYLVYGSEFALLAVLEKLGLKRFDPAG